MITVGARRRAGVVVVLGVLVVAVLGVAVARDWPPLLRLDTAVSRALYAGDDRSSTVSGLLEVGTTPGYAWFRAVVFTPVLVWLLAHRRWWTAGWVALATIAVGVLTTGLKELVGRVRPDFAEGGARLESLSFPSGHASGVACLVTTALLLAWPRLSVAARRWALVAGVALVLLVGLTRVWLGVHYLSDVVAGWSFGVAWTLLVASALSGRDGR